MLDEITAMPGMGREEACDERHRSTHGVQTSEQNLRTLAQRFLVADRPVAYADFKDLTAEVITRVIASLLKPGIKVTKNLIERLLLRVDRASPRHDLRALDQPFAVP